MDFLPDYNDNVEYEQYSVTGEDSYLFTYEDSFPQNISVNEDQYTPYASTINYLLFSSKSNYTDRLHFYKLIHNLIRILFTEAIEIKPRNNNSIESFFNFSFISKNFRINIICNSPLSMFINNKNTYTYIPLIFNILDTDTNMINEKSFLITVERLFEEINYFDLIWNTNFIQEISYINPFIVYGG